MNALDQLDHWHKMLKTLFTSDEAHKLFYQKMFIEERIEAVKELCDLVVVSRPLGMDQAPMSLLEMLIGKDDAQRALKAVNDENFSKLVLPHETLSAYNHFEKLGIEVEVKELDHGLFGAISTKTQTVNGKKYEKNKLLKGPNYKPVDYTKEFWR